MRKTLLTMFAAFSLMAGAQTFTVDNTTYNVVGEGEVTITSGDKDATVLNVPSSVSYEGQNYTVTAIGDEAYQWSKAEVVTIPGTIKNIGDRAFYYGSVLTLTLEEGIERIGVYAFGSSKCTSLDIPGSVKRIEANAFFGSSFSPTLENLTFHEGLEYIGPSAFYGNKVKRLEIPSSVKEIGKTAFLYSRELEELVFNEGLEVIGPGAFNNNEKRNKVLKHVDFPSTLKEIGQEAFFKMPLEGTITLPASLETLGGSAFASTQIEAIALAGENPNFDIVDGVLYNKNHTLLMMVPMKGTAAVNVLDGCLGIYEGSFWGSEVTDVTLPEGIVGIDYGAFQESKLKNINLPQSLSYIDEFSFAGSQIEKVEWPENCFQMYEATFAMCPNLKEVVLSSGLLALDVRAFAYSNNIEKVTCKGSIAPGLVQAYEGEEVFTCDGAKLYIPKGSKASYLEQREGSWDSWDTYFSLSDIIEMEKGTIRPIAVSPSMDKDLDKYQYASFQIQFAEPIELVQANPACAIRVNSPIYAGYNFGGEWKAMIEAGNTLTVFANDEDGFMTYFETEAEKDYYLTVPEGTVKNAEGELNDHLIFVWSGAGTHTPDAIEQTDIQQGSQAKVAARYNIGGQQIGEAQRGINIVRMTDGTVKKVMK